VARGASVLGRRWRWLAPVASRVLAAFPAGKALRRARLAEFLRRDPGFLRGCQHPKVLVRPGIAQPPLPPPTMSPVAGVVLNQHPNVARSEYDQLKAILHNCVSHSPAGQNRAGVPDFRAHLLGRIAHVAQLNPQRGERLKAVFDQIAW